MKVAGETFEELAGRADHGAPPGSRQWTTSPSADARRRLQQNPGEWSPSWS